MRTGRVMKRGFTLIETVVTVGIVAAMAAVVIPQVAKQFDVADPTRISNDLKNIQTAVETFSLNVRQMPSDLDDLANPVTEAAAILTAPDSSISSAGVSVVFGSGTNALWNGPYLDFALVENSTEITRPTGYGAVIYDDFVCYNATQSTFGNASGSPATLQGCPAPVVGTDRLFLAARITGLGTDADARWLAVNETFDGATEATKATNGRVRFHTVSSVPTTFFLISALN